MILINTKSRKTILQYKKKISLTEIWRKMNPDKLEYSCYSQIHKSKSRIDFFFYVTIILILKPGKIQTHCSLNRPIGLMWVDTKILWEVLAQRLDAYIPSVVHNDQNGFV